MRTRQRGAFLFFQFYQNSRQKIFNYSRAWMWYMNRRCWPIKIVTFNLLSTDRLWCERKMHSICCTRIMKCRHQSFFFHRMAEILNSETSNWTQWLIDVWWWTKNACQQFDSWANFHDTLKLKIWIVFLSVLFFTTYFSCFSHQLIYE